MKEYSINPTDGVREAFRVIHPQSTNTDFIAWVAVQDESENDPRLINYALANLCDRALSELFERQPCRSDPELVALIAGALAHYETSIRAFTAVIGHRKFERLSMLESVDALKACLPNIVSSADIN